MSENSLDQTMEQLDVFYWQIWSVDRSNINVLTLLKATFLHIISSIFETFCNIFNVIHHDCDVTFCKFLVKRFDILLNYPWIVKNRVNKNRHIR